MRSLSTFAVGLTLLFIGLRLTETITWPWLVVLSPLLLWMAVIGAVGLCVTSFILLVAIFGKD